MNSPTGSHRTRSFDLPRPDRSNAPSANNPGTRGGYDDRHGLGNAFHGDLRVSTRGDGTGEASHGQGAGVYDTKLVSQTLAHAHSTPQVPISSPTRYNSTRTSPIPRHAPSLASPQAQSRYLQDGPLPETAVASGSRSMPRSGSTGVDPYPPVTGHGRGAYSPPSSSAASAHSGRTGGSSGPRSASGVGLDNSTAHAGPYATPGLPMAAAPRSSSSFSRGPSTPSVPALSLTAATPSAPAPLAPVPAFPTGSSRAYSPATSAASGSGSGSGASSGLGMARGSGSYAGASGNGSGSASGGGAAAGAGRGTGSGGGSGGGVLSASAALLQAQGEFTRNAARTIRGALEHSSPNSPWSQLTVHALPVFTGSTVKTSMENLNRLCTNHITATNQRVAQSKVTAVIIADLRDFIASGMLTLKTRLEGDEAGLLERMSETWFFFWTRVLGFIEGVFLPFSRIQSDPTPESPMPYSLIPVRQLLLSGFMYHTVIPSLPQLLSLISTPDESVYAASNASASSFSPPSTPEMALRRLQQMTLILANQASYSAIRPPAAGQETTMRDAVAIAEAVDRDVKDQLEELAEAVKWKLDQRAGAVGGVNGSVTGAAGADARGAVPGAGSTAGRRRKGWRASLAPGMGVGALGFGLANTGSSGPVHALTRAGRQASNLTTNTHNSGTTSNQTHASGQPSSRWGPQRGHDTEDEDHTRSQRWDAGDEDQYEYAYGYEEDDDEEATIPAQSRNASIALDSGIGRFGHTRQSSDQSHIRHPARPSGERRGSDHAWREGSASLSTAPSTVTASGTFRLADVIGEGDTTMGEDMTPTPAPPLSEQMGRRGPNLSGDRRAAQRV